MNCVRKFVESSLGVSLLVSDLIFAWLYIGVSPDMKSSLTGKDPDAGKDWGQKVKGTAEDEMFK